MRYKIIILLSLFSASLHAQNSLEELLNKFNENSVPYISVEELVDLEKDGNVVILDAREFEEYEVSHIKNSLFVGYNKYSPEMVSATIKDPRTPIVVYCSLGIRSENISEKLKAAGFTDVRNLYGGIFEWKNKHNPVFDSEEKETEKVHAYSKSWSKWLTNGEKIY
jgi:rhodanese-related sulfurtransferase